MRFEKGILLLKLSYLLVLEIEFDIFLGQFDVDSQVKAYILDY
ncbi:TPA: hypothetical protein ACQNCC_001690 [Streptococcus pyogenes]